MARDGRGPKLKAQGEFGKLLRERREQLGWTQQHLASVVDCRPNYIGYLETGVRKPSSKLAIKMAKALDFDPQEFYLIAHPHMRSFLAPEERGVEDAWTQFRKNKRWQTRHNVTRKELDILGRVAKLGNVRSPRDFLFVLQSIRQALTDG